MNIVKKVAAVVVAAGVMMAGSLVSAAPAAAALTWISQDQVWSITDARTAVRAGAFGVGTVEVRYGTYQGRQYGWGRVYDVPSGYRVLFEVDTNGDRRPDEVASVITGSGARWTKGAPTSTSSDRAFRSCALTSSQSQCKDTTDRTPWW